MFSQASKTSKWVLALALVACLPSALAAQEAAKPAPSGDPTISKWDIFAGYSYLAPHGSATNGTAANAINYGSIVSLARYFNKYVGAQAEVDEHIPN